MRIQEADDKKEENIMSVQDQIISSSSNQETGGL